MPRSSLFRLSRAGSLLSMLLIAALVAACASTPRPRAVAHMASSMSSVAASPEYDSSPLELVVGEEPAPRPPPRTRRHSPRAGANAPAAASPPADPPTGAGVIATVDEQLTKRDIVYNNPKVLTYGRPTALQALINVKGGSVAQSFENLSGAITTHAIDVSREVTAELSGPPALVKIQLRPGFKPWQKLTSAGNPRWIWDVTALTPEAMTLALTVRAKVIDKDGVTEQEIETYHDTMTVRMGVLDRIKWWIAQIDPIWKWTGGVVTALGGALVWWRTNMARKKA